MRRTAITTALSGLPAWATALRLRPRRAALVGGGAGLLVGLLLALNMRSHAVFTERFQDLTAGAALLVLWTAIGLVAGLTVLAPEGPDL